MMTHDEMIAVIAAHKEGKEIQYQMRDCEHNKKWHDCSTTVWDFCSCNYRVKPEPREPREIWVNEYASGIFGISKYCNAWQSKDDAKTYGIPAITTRKFIEVIEEDEA